MNKQGKETFAFCVSIEVFEFQLKADTSWKFEIAQII